MRKILLVALALTLPTIAFAQSTSIEITPFAGYRWGGTISARDTDLFTRDVNVNDDSAWGLAVDIPINSSFQIELMADRQQSNLTLGDGLFGNDQSVADIDITYYHAGVLWQWETSPNVKPFFTIAGGVTTLDVAVPGASSETRASGSIGGGVKVMLNRNLGVRLEGRGYWTDTNSNEDRYWRSDNGLNQGEVKVGLILAF